MSKTSASATASLAIIAGVDEAGRGAVAGPVVAAACILHSELFRRRYRFPLWSPHKRKHQPDICIADSKSLTFGERASAFEWIVAHCTFGIGIGSVTMIESEGILAANEHAMQEAIRNLAQWTTPTYVLIDGCDHFWFDYPHSSIIRGDETEPCIAAASIVAKVTRDRLMFELSNEFPQYNFARHKGYGTPEHLDLIRKYGHCSLHRQSFLSRML